ncbi:MAG TPA: prolyl oligopeptidase family serine peptidase [Naasia sp.]|jgi:dipeptidyl aminopeptidase/acylaminoacyl peptidase
MTHTAAVLPYGSWPSPISAADVAGSSHPISGGRYVGDEIWWAELRGDEGGRYGVFRSTRGAAAGAAIGTSAAAGATIGTVLPAPWNARSRVHEYGGGAWTVTASGALVFVEFRDQRVYILEPGAEPVPLTAPADGDVRHGDLVLDGDSVLAVREAVDGHRATRDLVRIPLDGSGGTDPAAVRSIVAGSDFLAYPRVSPDGRRLAWIAWDHPDMPWDATQLRVGDLVDGRIDSWRTLAGGPGESVLQPEWLDDSTLLAVTDSSGWWNLVRVPLDGPVTPVLTQERETGGPLWNLGLDWYRILDDGTVAAVSTLGSDRLEVVEVATGRSRVLDMPVTSIQPADSRPGSLLVDAGSAALIGGLREIDLATGALREVRLDYDEGADPAYLPVAEERTFPGVREVHAIVYPPRNPDVEAPEGELPPYVAFVHGGPTTRTQAAVNPVFAYYTSRGIGVVDVNYGGSTGYGREYRERLRGQWGIVDLEDVVTAVTGLADAGLADPARLAIEGGSAGGWTVLSALTRTDVFACGTSLYGVADLIALAEDTHDFEARYTDGLVGPLPEARALYEERSPLSHVDGLDCPVLLLQGLDDKVVPPAQSERFRDALVDKGIPHAYLTFEGESHGFRKVTTRIRAREATLSFYGQVLGFETPGIPALELWRPAVDRRGAPHAE